MPSTSAKQHRFMEAVAHNPAFAKKAGVPQSVGKDFSAADKGRKFQKGGATMMGKKIPNVMADMMARRRPRMGAGMAPSAPSAPMGMKKGGKVRRFEEGGITEGPNKNIDDDTRARALAFVAGKTKYSDEAEGGGESRTFTANKKPAIAPATSKTPEATQSARPIPSNETNAGAVTGRTFTRPAMLKTDSPTAPKQMAADGNDFGAVNEDESRNTKAVTGRVDKVSKNMPSAAQKEENTERLGEGMLTAATLIPAGRLAKGAYTLNAERMRRADVLSSTAERKARFANRRSAKQQADVNDAFIGKRRGNEYARGGLMKFSKAGMHKMPDGKMMNKEIAFFKKKGAPASMVKHEEKEAKEMKFAKGGGIESRGKTKGTIIRMAAGGSVGSASRRADGIAQRGKTRG